jgi:hypothetical protein
MGFGDNGGDKPGEFAVTFLVILLNLIGGLRFSVSRPGTADMWRQYCQMGTECRGCVDRECCGADVRLRALKRGVKQQVMTGHEMRSFL